MTSSVVTPWKFWSGSSGGLRRKPKVLEPAAVRDEIVRQYEVAAVGTLDGAFALWDEYDTELERRLAALGPQALHLRYEVRHA